MNNNEKPKADLEYTADELFYKLNAEFPFREQYEDGHVVDVIHKAVYESFNACREEMQREIDELKNRLAEYCPYDCYFEGAHPACDSEDCKFLGYLFKDVK